jgi:hypothetical protein
MAPITTFAMHPLPGIATLSSLMENDVCVLTCVSLHYVPRYIANHLWAILQETPPGRALTASDGERQATFSRTEQGDVLVLGPTPTPRCASADDLHYWLREARVSPVACIIRI